LQSEWNEFYNEKGELIHKCYGWGLLVLSRVYECNGLSLEEDVVYMKSKDGKWKKFCNGTEEEVTPPFT